MFENTVEQFRIHAVECYPKEACGYVVNGEFLPKQNIHPDPLNYFEIDKNEYPLSGLEAVLHSHTRENLLQPSEDDMIGQLATGVPWGIVRVHEPIKHCIYVSKPLFWGINEIPPLVGRKFRHGPSGSDGAGDCYALIKDYFQLEKGIKLPEYPRSEDWYKTGGDLYRDNFENAGFTRISKSDLQPGDVFLAQIRSKVPNHGGIYLGNGLIMHHCFNQLSVREPITRFVDFITHYLRYNG